MALISGSHWKIIDARRPYLGNIDSMSDAAPSEEPVEEAFAAYLRSCDAGEIPNREEFLAQFPDIADDLKTLMETADQVIGMTMAGGGTGPTADTGADTVVSNLGSGADSGQDPAATLPMANRPKGDPGPTLPFDLGEYRLLEVLGRGGMGVVYLAKQKHLDRNVAVKMIRSGILAGEDEVKRFYTEARAAASLKHRGIVSVYQFGHLEGHHYFSMEFIEGTDLQRVINGEPIEIREAARYVRDVARAISHAHQNNVLHRDLKPANVLIDEKDQIHVTDFGLAKNLSADSSVTGTGAAVGTPHYMAPEQADGHSDRASKQSDVYSLGAILFATVTGRPPLVGDTVMQTLVQVINTPAPPMRTIRSGIPTDLETIVAKCLEKQPAKRYASAEELADELDAFLEGRPISARPRSAVIKTWHWLEGVPVVGALTGRHAVKASISHRRFQAGMLALILATPFILFGAGRLLHGWKNQLPTHVGFAGGLDGGAYTDMSTRIAERLKQNFPKLATSVTPTGGSFDNQTRLSGGEVDLAPMQTTATGDKSLCIVAPLFHEIAHVIVPASSAAQSVMDLKGKRIAVGPPQSGSRATAELVFGSLNLEYEKIEVSGWSDLEASDVADAALICVRPQSELISKLINTGKWRLLQNPYASRVALEHSLVLQFIEIKPDDYPDANLASDVHSICTTCYLTARKDAPDDLIRATLDAIYSDPPIINNLIPRTSAAEGPIEYHPVAEAFFRD